jgi:predicted dehydrogenase
VRVGLLGCGRISRIFHLRTLQHLAGGELVAIADMDTARLAEAAAVAPDAATFEGYRDLLEHPDVEAVVVALPTALHPDAAVAAFELGKHVYVEKPLAPTASEAAPVVEAWRRAGTVGAMGYVFRFHPVYRDLARAIDACSVGEVVAVRTSFGSASRDLPDWKRARATGGGALVDLASHHVDLLRFLFGREVVEVGAIVRSVKSEDDTALLELVLEGGLVVQTFASATAVQEDRVEVYGTRGKLVADRFGRTLEVSGHSHSSSRSHRILSGLEQGRRGVGAVWRTLVPPAEPSFALSLEAFVAAVRGGTFEGANLEDGYRALLVVEAADESARTGRRIPVSDQPIGR